jgi:hypothetical protein
MPVQWRVGWKAYLTIGERDRDGSLSAEIRVERPDVVDTYTRRVRLVPQERLPLDLG